MELTGMKAAAGVWLAVCICFSLLISSCSANCCNMTEGYKYNRLDCYIHAVHDASFGSVTSVPFTSSGFYPFNPVLGNTNAFDEPLTAGPGYNSSEDCGMFRGTIVVTSKNGSEATVVVSTRISHYDGYVVCVGLFDYGSQVNEQPIVGGTGYFRDAVGYCKQTVYFSFHGLYTVMLGQTYVRKH